MLFTSYSMILQENSSILGFHVHPEKIYVFSYFIFQGNASSELRGVFYLDAPSASVCLLIQLERHATEEGGVTPSVYSRKEPVRKCPSILYSLI